MKMLNFETRKKNHLVLVYMRNTQLKVLLMFAARHEFIAYLNTILNFSSYYKPVAD